LIVQLLMETKDATED